MNDVPFTNEGVKDESRGMNVHTEGAVFESDGPVDTNLIECFFCLRVVCDFSGDSMAHIDASHGEFFGVATTIVWFKDGCVLVIEGDTQVYCAIFFPVGGFGYITFSFFMYDE